MGIDIFMSWDFEAMSRAPIWPTLMNIVTGEPTEILPKFLFAERAVFMQEILTGWTLMR